MKNGTFTPMADAVREAYARGENDEALEPLVLVNSLDCPVGRFKNNDSVIFYDIRGEREIELTTSMVDRYFNKFPVEKPLNLAFLTMIEYEMSLPVSVAFPPVGGIDDTLCSVFDRKSVRFARITESEKAVHLFYFLDGKSHRKYKHEERILIPSLKTNPENHPGMMLGDVVRAVMCKLDDDSCRVIIANFANIDVVGHSENRSAIIQAVEAVDAATGKVTARALEKGVITVITADHGTVERWIYPDGTIDTGHTDSPIPFIIVESVRPISGGRMLRTGSLIDVAPTVLDILKLKIPTAMTGKTLYQSGEKNPERRILLLILDGWGIGKKDKGNLIHQARTPNMDRLIKKYPNTHLSASGLSVGNPKGTVGNSEVGHLHIGAGRIIESDRTRIDRAIKTGEFFKNREIKRIMRQSRKNGVLHLLGIISFYSSHGSVNYLRALMAMAKSEGVPIVFIHSILGRRGEKAESGAQHIQNIECYARKLELGTIVSVIGRHWALDREENWERIEKTYQLLVFGKGRAVRDDG